MPTVDGGSTLYQYLAEGMQGGRRRPDQKPYRQTGSLNFLSFPNRERYS